MPWLAAIDRVDSFASNLNRNSSLTFRMDSIYAEHALDTAIATNNTELTGAVLDSVLKLADSSPFKALRDVAATREALSEKGKEWQF